MSIHYSPLRYPGGKNCIFPFLSKLFYENQLLGCSYAEPYAGGAGLALRLLFEGYVDHIYINDLDNLIYSFWKVILEYPKEFCHWVKNVEVTIENWEKFKEIQKSPINRSDFELAQSAFFLNRTNVSGIIKGGVIGGKNQLGQYKMDVRFNKEDLVNRIQVISKVKSRISLSCEDGLTFIKRIERKSDNTLIYMDPPYFVKGYDLYMNFYKEEDHYKLNDLVGKIQNNWIVSYDHHHFIIGLYEKQQKISYNLSQSASNRVGKEIFIFSEKLEFKESLNNLNSVQLIG